MQSSHRTFIILCAVALTLLVGLLVLVVGHIRGLEQQIGELRDANGVAVRRAEAAEATLSTSQSDMADVEAELSDLQKPQAVAGPANFPISRVLAQRDDTVAALAKRQNTSPAVVYALNPWLDGESDLTVGQAIWIPNGAD